MSDSMNLPIVGVHPTAPNTSISSSNPSTPSELEAANYLHGLPSKGRLIARSTLDRWVPPTGPHPSLVPKQLPPFRPHRQLDATKWTRFVGPAMRTYLNGQKVMWTLLLPVQLGPSGGPSSAIILVGVLPKTLAARDGVEHVVHLRKILADQGIIDIHVIIYESECYHSASTLYEPTFTLDPAATHQPPFSWSLGIPISPSDAPYLAGTGGLILRELHTQGPNYLLTARHVLFLVDKQNNSLFQYHGTGQDKKTSHPNGSRGLPETSSIYRTDNNKSQKQSCRTRRSSHHHE
jgi:hypothetical protein